jgi:hypothetical protein
MSWEIYLHSGINELGKRDLRAKDFAFSSCNRGRGGHIDFTMKTPKGWTRVKKAPEPTYRNDALGVRVFLSHVAHTWLISRDGSGVQSGEYLTPHFAMKAAERMAP